MRKIILNKLATQEKIKVWFEIYWKIWNKYYKKFKSPEEVEELIQHAQCQLLKSSSQITKQKLINKIVKLILIK